MVSGNDRHLYGHNHIKGCWEYHVEWCPKYRICALEQDSKRELVERVLKEVALDIDVAILELAVMPDHVHVLVRCFKPMNPSYLLFRFKGRSSYEMFKQHPNFRKRYPRGHFWSRGNFCRSVGADLDIERNYIRNQQDIHQTRIPQWAS